MLGLGRNGGGVGVARWAAREGAEVVVTDQGSAKELQASIRSLDGVPVGFTLEGHDPADLEWADLVIRNPAVPADSWMLERARELGRPVTMEMALFLDATEATVIGITGSKGKTTTSYATEHLLKGSFPRVELVGNMGISALDSLPLGRGSVAVAEVSSFQAEGMTEHGTAPHAFAVTNLLEDHLDRYVDVDAYHEAKTAVLDHQEEDDWAILPSRRFDREQLEPRARGRIAYFEAAGEPLPDGAPGVSCSGEALRMHWDGRKAELVRVDALPMKAEHYLSNIAAAACVALVAGVDPESLRDRLLSLRPLKDRQEIVATLNDVLYVNDTTATMPAAAAASIRSYSGRDLVLIAGGASKRLDPKPLAVAASALARHVVLLDGPATAGIERALHRQGFSAISTPHDSMESAVIAAHSLANPGSVVLLAPGASSFGMFQNEFDRGHQFREAILGRAGEAFARISRPRLAPCTDVSA